MRVLLVDNYDSFAWNLVQALRSLGADVDVRRNDEIAPADVGDAPPGAIVVSPGPRSPADAGVSVPLVRLAAARAIPLLGVCLGHQAIGEAFGGRTVRAARPVHGKTSEVHHDGRCEFEGLPRPFTAMRYHSLVTAEPLPGALVRSAWTEARVSGDAAEVMAVRHVALPILGWQFHPESFMTPEGPRLLARFLDLAARRGAPAAEVPR